MAVTNRAVHPEMGRPAHEQWRCESAGGTDRGRVRRANEDAMLCLPEARAFVVCDGMGGAAGGATASRLAAESAIAVLAGREPGPPAITEAVRTANHQVYSGARKDWRLEGMGTTMVVLSVGDGVAWVGHVGDSRCYHFRRGTLRPLTRDHSFVEEQMRIGRMTPQQARRSPMRNVITRAIGTRPEVSAEIAELALEPGDIFLLASDGLTREVDEAGLREVLTSGGDLQAACDRLIALANRAGGRDNITCVLVRVGA